MRHSETGQILPARCNSHLCPSCSPLHQMTARRAFEIGMVERCVERGRDCVVWLTLTDTSRGELDLPRLTKQLRASILWLRRNWGATEYAASREFQDRGALHPHLAVAVYDQVADDLMDRKSRSSYRRRMHELRPMAERHGWGSMVDAVTIDGIADMQKVARYAAKSVAGYATKEAAEKFKRVGAKNVRPISLSYGWYPGGLAGARRAVLGQPKMAASKIEGRWERIPKPRAC
jgi:Zn-finger nucleic acid-binding protein